MMDAGAVAWKEWRELIGQRGIRGKAGMVLFAAAFGIALPLMNGPVWVTSPTVAIAWSWVPMFLVTTVIADAIAGERERHTLETLLASRLSDQAILFGKIGAAVGYAGAMTVLCLILGVVTVNVSNARTGLVFYSLSGLLLMFVLGLLGAVLVAAIGVLISLRSATVRQAQQSLAGAIMVLLLGPMVAARLLPAEWKHTLVSSGIGGAELGFVGLVAFVALDAIAIAFAMTQFRRVRLILT